MSEGRDFLGRLALAHRAALSLTCLAKHTLEFISKEEHIKMRILIILKKNGISKLLGKND